MKKLTAIGLTLGFIVSFAPTAFAQGVNVGVDADVSVQVGGGTNGTASSSSSGSVSGSGQTNTGANTTTNTSGSDDTETSGSVEGSGITITRATASDNSGVSISVPTMVETSSDLSAYASTVVNTDANVESAELSEEEVSVLYKQRARLFGFIPVFVPVKATVESNGDVSVKYPWYGFLVSKKERATLESQLSTAVTANANASLESGAELSSKTQAWILDRIHATLKQNLDASLQAEANAEGSANVN